MLPMTPAEVAWTLYREGPGRYDAATELARGIVGRRRRAGPTRWRARAPCCSSAGSYDDADAPRARALEHGAAPQLLAYLDTACALRTGSGRAARAALVAAPGGRARPAAHRHAVAGRHRRRADARRGRPRDARGCRAPQAVDFAARGAWRRSPQRACRAVCGR